MGDGDDDEDDISPFPPARAARIPSEVKEEKAKKLSAVLVPRSVGYLVVRVTFHKDPCAGVKVSLYETDDSGKKAAQVGDEMVTNKYGIVRVPWMVNAGLYVCAIEGQDETVITTIGDLEDAYEVVTPVGRPYVDVDENDEWDDDDVPQDDGEEEELDGPPMATGK